MGERNKKYMNALDVSEEMFEQMFFNDEVKIRVIQEILNEVERLTPGLRNVFKLSYIQHVSDKEIAKQLHMKMRSVYNAKHRALSALREKFKGVYVQL